MNVQRAQPTRRINLPTPNRRGGTRTKGKLAQRLIVARHCGAASVPAGIGLEPTLGEWVQNIVAVGREVWRVLRDDGTFWLNLGDSYASSAPGNKTSGLAKWATSGLHGAKISAKYAETLDRSQGQRRDTLAGSRLTPKNLLGQPWRVALALQDDGWILRSDIIWHKPNPMPQSVRDRPTSAHEYIFLLTKQARYFYDAEAIREPAAYGRGTMFRAAKYTQNHAFNNSDNSPPKGTNAHTHEGGRNSRNVWSIATQGYTGAHFATFPEELPRRCILAGTSAHGVCAECGAPWTRVTKKTFEQSGPDRTHISRRFGRVEPRMGKDTNAAQPPPKPSAGNPPAPMTLP